MNYEKYTFEEREHIKDLSRDHILGEVLDGMSAKYMQLLKSSGSGDAERREHYYRMSLAIDELKTDLKAIETDERLARKPAEEAPSGTTDPVMDLRMTYLKRAKSKLFDWL